MLQSGRWRLHPTGHNLPVRVTFQFLMLVCPVIELNGRYSAIKLTPSLPRPGHNRPVESIIQFEY